ncbi:unnamed protein product [Prunus brigantina]
MEDRSQRKFCHNNYPVCLIAECLGKVLDEVYSLGSFD